MRYGGIEKGGDGEKSMEAEMSLSISSWESKITDRLLLLFMVIVLAVVLVLVLVVWWAGLQVLL